MKRSGIITLTTDFGLVDHYVGAMKGVILGINPKARMVDVTHGIPQGNVERGSYAMESSYAYFPAGTVHVGVVDPGVGGERHCVAIETGNHFFVGPDNGLLYRAASRDKIVRVVSITNQEYTLDNISNTFHGRDVFAPVAAHLSKGVELSLLGAPFEGLKALEERTPITGPGWIDGEVTHADSFGNLITNIPKDALNGAVPDDIVAEAQGIVINGLSKTYSQRPDDAPILLISSCNRLEIAVVNGSAKERLDIKIGTPVRVYTRRAG